MKIVRLLLAVWTALLMLSGNVLATDTLRVSPKIGKKHVALMSMVSIVNVVPPDKTFKQDTSSPRAYYGLRSEKYNSMMTFMFKTTNLNMDSSFLSRANDVLKRVVMKSNGVNVTYYKLRYKFDGSIHWLAKFTHPYFDMQMNMTYKSEYDKYLAPKVEETIKTLIVTSSPNIKPETKSLLWGDTSILASAGLHFVPVGSWPMSFYTSDTLPPIATAGRDMLILFAFPINVSASEQDLAELCEEMWILNKKVYFPDSLDFLPENIVNYEFVTGMDGIRITGSLTDGRKYIMYYAKSKIGYSMLVVYEDSDTAAAFLSKMDTFRKTLNIDRSVDKREPIGSSGKILKNTD